MGYRLAKDATGRVYREKVDPDAIARVLEAYKAAGSLLGAARALNDAGVPCPRPDLTKGGSGWHAATVRRVIRREAPELLPPTREPWRRGVPGERRDGAPRILTGLLRCHCGSVMTPGSSVRGGAYYYYCNRGLRDKTHSRPYAVSEKKLLPWIEDEAAWFDRARILEREVDEPDDSADRARLEAARDLIGEDAYLDAVARLDAAKASHGGRRATLEALPDSIDWEHDDVAAINAVLRAYWDHVELGPDLLPIRAAWRFDPEAAG
jgi:hypothetical protein